MGKPLIIVEVSGGVVQQISSDSDVEVILVDWDNIQEGDDASAYHVNSLCDLSPGTREEVDLYLAEIGQPLLDARPVTDG